MRTSRSRRTALPRLRRRFRSEHAGPQPGAEEAYLPGYWHWVGKAYVWAPGRWAKKREGMRYTQPTYLEEKGQWVRHGLGWEKESVAWEQRYAGWEGVGDIYVPEKDVEAFEKRGEHEGWRKAVPRKRVDLSPWNPRRGGKEPKVTVVEWCDFQCPFCAGMQPTLKKIEETYGKDVAIVIKNWPLPFHDKAMGAALALQAAHHQGKAWVMFDKMFTNQGALASADLQKYAKDGHLDVARFTKDLDDPKTKEEVLADQKKQGRALAVNGTPFFFINGRSRFGAMPFAKLKALIDDEMKHADEIIKAGTPVAEVYKKIEAEAP